MKPILKNNGVIIKTRDYKDNSKIITILTEEGMVDLILRGTNSMSSGNKKYTVTPSFVEFLMSKSNSISTFTEGFILDNFNNIKLDNNKSLINMAIIEKVVTFSTHIDNPKQFFDFCLLIFKLLDSTMYPNIVLNLFEIKLLYLIGIAPVLNHCLRCNSNTNLLLSINNGGTVCSKCSYQLGYDLNSSETELFKYLYLIKLEKIDEDFLKIVSNLNIKLDDIIDKYYEKHIDFHSKTKKIIKKVL